jgi:ribosome recycling factor
MDPVLQEVNQKIDQALLHLQRELSAIRAGKANPSLLEDIPVSAYGAQMKMVEVGTISAPQPSLLTVQVWDASLVKEVEKAIQEAKLGLNPAADGTTVRVPIPPLTEERREEYAKAARGKCEEARVEVRQIRQGQREDFNQDKESKVIGEDELERLEKQLQDLIDKAMSSIDEMMSKKEQELKEI